ncbi:MAG: hypothetical protein HY721_13425, partial [Planctomycetes bacterium]|nr:hypothetical protein [Planctomycetota bacterium]
MLLSPAAAPSLTALVLVLGSAGGGPGGAQRGLKDAAGEIAALARDEDGSSSPENLERLKRLREVLGEVAAVALAAGDASRDAWGLLAGTAARRERRVAMECALALLGLRGDEALRALAGAFPRMDAAVRRQTSSLLLASGRPVAAARPELLGALAAERDPECLALLVRLAASLGTLEAARAIVAAAPPLEPRAEGREPGGASPPDAWGEARAAVLESLGAIAGTEAGAWLSGPAFDEAGRDREGSPHRLVLLLRAAAA